MESSTRKQAEGRTTAADAVSTGIPGTLPVWGAQTMAPAVSELFARGTAWEPKTPVSNVTGSDGDEGLERGWRPMARFARIAAALSALATILIVTGASTKY